MKSTFQSRCVLLCSVLVAGLTVLSGRLVQIQLVDRQLYAVSSRKTFHSTEKLPAIRGMIVDRNEEPLAKSIPVCTLYIDKNHLDDPKLAAFGLAYREAITEPGWQGLDAEKRSRRIRALRGEILEREKPEVIVQKHLAHAIGLLATPLRMRREELREKIEGNKSKWFAIAKEIPEDLADGLRDLVSENYLQGFRFQSSIKRWYTSPELAAHVIGFTGEVEKKNENGSVQTSVKGRFGIESSMEEYLAGRDGFREQRRDARGLVVPGNSGSLLPPRAGLNVQLTLDIGIQMIVEEELDAALKEYAAPRGAIVVLDPKTGDILAMASRPNFDLNRKENLAENGFNFALQAIYEPGSTFKIVATAGVMNERLASPRTSVFCHNGLYSEGSIRVPDHHPYGSLTLEGILQKSSNIGAYKLARQLGTARFYDYVQRFGFGRKSGIQLSGESSGIARNSGNPVDFSRASYGYALNVTPLQMAYAYGALANGGKLLKPRIVKTLVANDGTIVEDFPTEVVSQAVSADTAKKMCLALEKVVLPGGTATLAAVPGFRAGGKTGTARRHNPNGRGYLANSYTVSFAGMLPVQDPAFVAIVVIDDPRTTKVSRYGGTVAAPVFGKIAPRIAARLNLQPTEPISSHPLATSANQ
ncbi:MAG: penicillin-binding protein 2 [Luteolibacter sp.]